EELKLETRDFLFLDRDDLAHPVSRIDDELVEPEALPLARGLQRLGGGRRLFHLLDLRHGRGGLCRRGGRGDGGRNVNAVTGSWFGYGDRGRPFLGYGSNSWRLADGCRQRLRFPFLQLRAGGGRALGGGGGSCRLVHALRSRHFPTGGADRLFRRTGSCRLSLRQFRRNGFGLGSTRLAR